MINNIKYKESSLALLLPIIWLILSLLWLFYMIVIKFDYYKFVFFILSLLCSMIWFYKYYWITKNYYISFNEEYLEIDLSFIRKKEKIFWIDVDRIDYINNNKINLLSRNKSIYISINLMDKEDYEQCNRAGSSLLVYIYFFVKTVYKIREISYCF